MGKAKAIIPQVQMKTRGIQRLPDTSEGTLRVKDGREENAAFFIPPALQELPREERGRQVFRSHTGSLCLSPSLISPGSENRISPEQKTGGVGGRSFQIQTQRIREKEMFRYGVPSPNFS